MILEIKLAILDIFFIFYDIYLNLSNNSFIYLSRFTIQYWETYNKKSIDVVQNQSKINPSTQGKHFKGTNKKKQPL